MNKMHRRLLILLAACIALITIGAASVSAATSITTGSQAVTTTALNMRATASTSGRLLTTIPQGRTVSVRAVGSTWDKIYYNGKIGYVSNKYITHINNVANTSWVTTRVMAASIRLRQSASTSATQLAIIASGQRLVVLGKTSSGAWYKVSYAGYIGYIQSGYFTTDVTYNVTKTGVWMRKGPGTSYAKIQVVPTGAKVTCFRKSNGWWYVKYNGKVGYMKDGYFKTSSSSSTTTGTTKVVSTSGTGLNFRSAPSTSASIYTSIPNGKVVTYVKTVYSNGLYWAQIKYNGDTGYVVAKYLK